MTDKMEADVSEPTEPDKMEVTADFDKKSYKHKEMSTDSDTDNSSEHSFSNYDDISDEETEAEDETNAIDENHNQDEENAQIDENQILNAEDQLAKARRLSKIILNVSKIIALRLKKVSIFQDRVLKILGDDKCMKKVDKNIMESTSKFQRRGSVLGIKLLLKKKNGLVRQLGKIIHHIKDHQPDTLLQNAMDQIKKIRANPDINDTVKCLTVVHRRLLVQENRFSQLEMKMNQLYRLLNCCK